MTHKSETPSANRGAVIFVVLVIALLIVGGYMAQSHAAKPAPAPAPAPAAQ